MQDMDQTIADLGNEPPLIAEGERPARPARGVCPLAFRDFPDWRHFKRSHGRRAVCSTRRSRAARHPTGDRRARRPRKQRRFGEKRQDGATRAAAPDRQGQGPPPHGSVDGHKVGDRDVIKTMPFVQIKMALAAGHTTTEAIRPSIRSRSSPRTARRNAAPPRPARSTA